mmetsp:Transcript_8163/g.14788  ORF Transcript_8163/g.14788 Transcript_8163/m.14788 type:complete len:156 (-) Transcript_8163:106-573(-)
MQRIARVKRDIPKNVQVKETETMPPKSSFKKLQSKISSDVSLALNFDNLRMEDDIVSSGMTYDYTPRSNSNSTPKSWKRIADEGAPVSGDSARRRNPVAELCALSEGYSRTPPALSEILAVPCFRSSSIKRVLSSINEEESNSESDESENTSENR